jgi:hypothetical protein
VVKKYVSGLQETFDNHVVIQLFSYAERVKEEIFAYFGNRRRGSLCWIRAFGSGNGAIGREATGKSQA